MIDFKTFNLKLEAPKDKEIEILGNKIKVHQYISAADTRDLLLITLQQSVVDHIINDFYLDINFHVNLIKMFTDIIFNEEDLKDNFELFDKLDLTGILDSVIEVIPEKIYEDLKEYLEELVNKYERYNLSVINLANSLIEQLPKSVTNAEDIVSKFNKDNIEQIVNLARSTGYQG